MHLGHADHNAFGGGPASYSTRFVAGLSEGCLLCRKIRRLWTSITAATAQQTLLNTSVRSIGRLEPTRACTRAWQAVYSMRGGTSGRGRICSAGWVRSNPHEH
jgi:hypothetical protein